MYTLSLFLALKLLLNCVLVFNSFLTFVEARSTLIDCWKMTAEKPLLANLKVKNVILKEFISEMIGTFILVVSIAFMSVPSNQSFSLS